MGCNCKTSRYCCPDGIWSYENMIGAKVAVRSTTIGNFNTLIDGSGEYKIKDIYFRVSIDGKTITVVELEGLDGSYFTFKDLEILSVVNEPNKRVLGDGLVIGGNTI